ncbi:ANTAR domain-containing protein [Ornithinimicrobium sufpigmenti]|uniref:ANTAR domain-containing protein n=1 Tax=Ornithinimicrobium sufpigmenti TaxID=2508882 RepID=UPI0010355CDD|nr:MULTISPECIES: ANTAR domain-containing protein [unclassified Ornithinimicrobium]
MNDRPREAVTEVAADMSGLLNLLASSTGTGLDLARLVFFACRSMPVESTCGLTLVRKGRAPRTMVATDEVARVIDALQHEVGEGPSLEAARVPTLEPADDLSTESRWPEFARRCVEETGIRSMLAVRLPLAGGDVASLTFSSRFPSAFGELTVGLAALYAPIAALGVEQLLRQQDAEELGTALTSSRQIGTAIGIIMERNLVTSEEAMAILRRSSQHLNRKLRDIAAEVAETGEMPPEPPADASR